MGHEMTRMDTKTAGKQLKLPLFGAFAALAMALPSAGLAVVGLGVGAPAGESTFDLFTPASVDPELAARVADKARERGIHFTPAGTTTTAGNDRTVTVAVRIDDQTAQAIPVRSAVELVPGAGSGIAGIQASRFNLGTARGYQSFARTQTASTKPSATSLPEALRNVGTRNLASSARVSTSRMSNPSMPDLSEFEPARSTRVDEPSRLQTRIELGEETITGRSPNTLDDLASQTVDVGGSFRLSPNLNVRAGVRLSQERDRLDPVTNSVQDSQAVYVGTQIRF